ncbi:uncharacterized protein LOC130720910 isoform X2 [Lotus japonicus]|uniref:uncharacterized protein LOC130720910 isoform X2 n=1 Tax=Lotus japonicus TaxID=34305 RepID=UPI00258CE44E|nr:uncharacterized protein LOC130720910 isoform X2 [Lotus japonicus]
MFTIETELAAIDHVTSIHEQGPRLVIKVCAVAVWRIPLSILPIRPYCVEMILIDRMGTKIQGSVCSNHPILRNIQVGRVYKFSKFKVILNDDIKLTPHDFRLIFHTCTEITESYDVRIPRHGWSFYNTQAIRARNEDFTHLIDCVGVISAASQEKLWIKDGQMTKMIIIELQDPRGKIKCNLIGSVVNPIAEFLASTWTVRPIVVLQLVKVNRCRGDKFIIEGIPIASKVHINPDIDEVAELTHRMSVLGYKYNGPVGFIMHNDPNVDLKDDMLYHHTKKTLTELIETKEGGVFIVHAAIVGVIRDGDWAYKSCRCYSQLRINGSKYQCLKCCRVVGQMIHRFRIKVEVYDGVNSAVFVLYDREVEDLTGFSCEELMNTIDLENKVIPDGEYPQEIEDALGGQDMLFKVRNKGLKAYGNDQCFDVMRICTDLEIIDMFNEHEVIVTPNKEKFIPPFPTIENTVAEVGQSSSLKGQANALSECSSTEHGGRRLRRKLLQDIESAAEDGDVAEPQMTDIQSADMVNDVLGDLKQNLNETVADQVVTDVEDAELVAVDEANAKKNDKIVVSAHLSKVVNGKNTTVDHENEKMGALDVFGVDISAVNSEVEVMHSSADEDMDDILDICGIHREVRVDVHVSGDVNEIDKVVDGNEIIVLSDDEVSSD